MSKRMDLSDILKLPLKFAASLPCLRGNVFQSLSELKLPFDMAFPLPFEIEWV